MKTTIHRLIMRLALAALLLSALLHSPSTASAQGTAFTYQGRLNTNNAPYSGSAEFQFTLWDAASDGNAVATNNPVSLIAAVTDGLFTVTLDFGLNPFNGQPRFLQTDVRTAIGPFTTLTPRQPVTATPYALRALNLTTNGLAGAYANAVTFNNAGNSFAGGFTGAFTGTANGDGMGLTNVNAATLGGLSASNFWKLGGNSNTIPGTHFLGTMDNKALEIKVSGHRALRLEPDVTGFYPNFIAGSDGNSIAAGLISSTIGGGEENNIFLSAGRSSEASSTIGGGAGNSIGATVSGELFLGGGANFIGGGHANNIRAKADFSTIGGGENNIIPTNSQYATIPGGDSNSATNYGFAAGRRAKANHTGAFVWADSTDANFASTGTNQFLIRASGGVGVNTTTPVSELHVNGNLVIQGPVLTPGITGSSNLLNLMVGGGSSAIATNGSLNGISFYEASSVKAMSLGYDGSGSSSVNALRIYSSTDVALFSFQNGGSLGIGTNTPAERLHVVGNILASGTITPNSDRNAKTDIETVSAQEILEKVAAMPVSSWRFKTEASEVRHIGPMAQDFHAAFGLGERSTAIATVDADGVALAAIQGLNQKLDATRAENAELRHELAELKKLVRKLVADDNGGAK